MIQNLILYTLPSIVDNIGNDAKHTLDFRKEPERMQRFLQEFGWWKDLVTDTFHNFRPQTIINEQFF